MFRHPLCSSKVNPSREGKDQGKPAGSAPPTFDWELPLQVSCRTLFGRSAVLALEHSHPHIHFPHQLSIEAGAWTIRLPRDVAAF